MNKFVIALISLSIGAVGGSLTTSYILKKRFVQQRIDEMEAFERNHPSVKKGGVTEKIENEKEDILDPKSGTPIEVASFSSHKINTDARDYSKISEKEEITEIAEDGKPVSGRYPWKDNLSDKKTISIFDKENRPKPYIITKKQYGEENLHFHKVTLMAIDNGRGFDLVDDDEEPYDAEMVGPENLEQFGVSDHEDDDVIYVRNEPESTDFEIIKIDR